MLITLLLCLPLLGSGQPAQAAPALVRLPGHIPAGAIARAHALGRVARSETLSLALTLPLRDPAGLENFLNRLYTPSDPLYGHFLAPAEFTSRFGPTQQSYDAVIAFARTHGMKVMATHPNRLLLDVSGPASAVEAAFSVRLGRYQSREGRVFRAPESDPAIPAALVGRLAGVIGLDNAAVWRPHVRRLSASSPLNFTGIGSDQNDQGLTPSDIKKAYNLNGTTLNGKGQTLGLFELDGYTPSDITAYETAYGLPAVPLQNIMIDGFDGTPGGGAVEVTLDIELMTALAPGASKILVYEAPFTDITNFPAASIDVFNKIANDNLAKEISTSWGVPENDLSDANRGAENSIFRQMAAQGQSIFDASGDNGAFDDGQTLSVDDPAGQPYMCAVGGTNLTVAGPGGAYVSEKAWGDPNEIYSSPFGGGSGGGVSSFWPAPDYQIGLGISPTQRNVPDVALDADPATGYSIYFSDPQNPGQPWMPVGGTSCAAPLWAAFTALVNQQRAANGEATLGFANPTIYQIGRSGNYSTAFHDVADGTNLYYPALSGYDNATGWGSFNGVNLLALLAPAINTTANPITSLTLLPNPVVGGLTVVGTVTLTNPAPDGGASVILSTSDAATAPVPTTVFLTAGQTSANFRITTAAVKTPTPVNIMATYLNFTQTATLTVLSSPPAITPMSLALAPDTVNGGDTSTATVTLSGPAPAGGLSVALSSGDPAATVPASVLVPAGAVSASFTVKTTQVVKQVSVTLTATANKGSATATLTVQAPTLEKLRLDPDHLPGGQSSIGNLALTAPAPAGGAVVTLSSDNAAAQVPASALIPAGAATATFPITTSSVQTTVVATIKATYNGLTQTAKLTILSPQILSITVAPASVTSGTASTGTVTLDSPAALPAGLVVALSESSTAATIPATVTVPQGAATVTFPIPTIVVSSPVSDTLTATLDSRSKTTVLTIQPIQVINLSLSPSQVVTGVPSQGTVTVNAPAPAGGVAVALSSFGAAETLPATALVPAGATSVTFPVTTPTPGITTISAVVGGQTRTATLTVTVAPGTSYPAGLSMISAPYDYSGQSLDAVFGITGVKLAVHVPNSALSYNITPQAPADALRLGQGYWVRLAKAVTLTSVGAPADPKTDFPITLSAGWNQIGDPFLVPITLGNLHVSSGGGTVTFAQAGSATPLLVSGLVYSWSQSAGSGKGAYVLTGGDGSLQPGAGYWIYAYQPVTLIIPHPGQ